MREGRAMRRRLMRLLASGVACAITAIAATAISAQAPGQPVQPARDTPAQRPSNADQPAKGRISGRVLAADTARPVRRARVSISAAELQGGRAMLTADDGSFDFTELPGGRYTLTVSKTGFLNLSYGQRRPLQAGTPLQLADGQALTGIDFRLPRGSVVAGHIYDDSGDPLPGANVRVLRYEYAQGNRQLVPVGTAQTDDQGAYRVWGLNPGDYYVTAVSRTFDVGGRGGPGGFAPGRGGPPGFDPAAGGRGGPFGGRGGPPAGVADPSGQSGGADAVAYAPTYYPGVSSVAEARPLSVGLSAEILNINFPVLLVRTGRVSGRVISADGSSTGNAMVTLAPEDQTGRGGGMNLGSRVAGDGSFAISNVPPGRYTLLARGGRQDAPLFAQQPLTLSDGDLSNLTVIVAPGATISGTVTFQATQSAQVPDASQVRVVAPAIDFAGLGPNPVARVDRQGRFAIDGVSAGLHWIRPQGGLRGWTLKSVMVGGRDVIDTPLELRSGQTLAGVSLVFSDKLTELNGTLSDNRNTPLPDFTVLAFPTDASLWRPQSRQIMTARPDQNGKFQIRGLPPGDYFLAPVDPTEQGEWFEPAFLEQHQAGAARLSLGEGDVKTQDFKLAQ